MGRWGTRTYVNCYFTHIIGVSLLCLSPLGQLCLFYMHLYLFYSILLFCIATLDEPKINANLLNFTFSRLSELVSPKKNLYLNNHPSEVTMFFCFPFCYIIQMSNNLFLHLKKRRKTCVHLVFQLGFSKLPLMKYLNQLVFHL